MRGCARLIAIGIAISVALPARGDDLAAARALVERARQPHLSDLEMRTIVSDSGDITMRVLGGDPANHFANLLALALVVDALDAVRDQVAPTHPDFIDISRKRRAVAGGVTALRGIRDLERILDRIDRDRSAGPDVNDVSAELAASALRLGDPHSASEILTHLEVTAAPRRLPRPAAADAWNQIAAFHQAQERYADAERAYGVALSIATAVRDPPRIVQALAGLGATERIAAKRKQARYHLDRRLALVDGAAVDPPILAAALVDRAALAIDDGELALAEQLATRAMAVMASPATLHQRAAVLEARGQLGAALALRERAAELEEHELVTQLVGGEPRRLAAVAALAGATYAILALQARMPDDQAAARLALVTVLRRKGRVLDSIARDVGALRMTGLDEDARLLAQLADRRGDLAKGTIAGPRDGNAARFETWIRAVAGDIPLYEEAVAARSAQLRRATPAVTIAAIQGRIEARTALVEIARYRPAPSGWRYSAFVLHETGEPIAIDLGDAATIDAGVARLRAQLADPGQDPHDAARALELLVFEPLRSALGSSTTVVVAPDGALSLVPFGALIDPEDRYLIERFDISYLTSGRDLLASRVASSRLPPRVVADPDYGMAAPDVVAPTFPRLPGTAAEAEAIHGLLPHAIVITGRAAGEAALGGAPAIVLHIATHGYFRGEPYGVGGRGLVVTGAAASAPPDDAPLLRSGLALAGANEPPTGAGDGLLTALEATGLDLNGTQLVVLSACETGVGELHAGEGVFGLRRAFVIAGARSLVMSLWKVDDAATRDLMVAYYTRLRAGQPRTSLREVQLAMLADPRTTHPYFWASFILQGERGPLEARPSSASSIHGRRGCGCHGGTRDIGLVVAAALLLVLRRSRGSPSWRQP